jgi:hypothetical protein
MFTSSSGSILLPTRKPPGEESTTEGGPSFASCEGGARSGAWEAPRGRTARYKILHRKPGP